jgi:hypothetical protein
VPIVVNEVVPSVVTDVPVDSDEAPEEGREFVGMVSAPIGAANAPEDTGRESEPGLMAAGSDRAPDGKLTRKEIREKNCTTDTMVSFINAPPAWVPAVPLR